MIIDKVKTNIYFCMNFQEYVSLI